MNNSTASNLFEHQNTSEWNHTYIDDGTAYTSSGANSSINAFFILPAMGLLVSIAGFIYLRRRRTTQSERSAEILHARIHAYHETARKKMELRMDLVQSALVTTTVVLRHEASPETTSSSAFTEECTLDSSSSSSTMNSNIQCTDIEAQINHEQNTKALTIMTLKLPMKMDPPKLDQCVICQEPYQENDVVSYSKHQNCNHVFHTGCIWNWLQDEFRNDCPVCRSQYVHACITEMSYDLFDEISPAIEEEPGGDDNMSMNGHTTIEEEGKVEHD